MAKGRTPYYNQKPLASQLVGVPAASRSGEMLGRSIMLAAKSILDPMRENAEKEKRLDDKLEAMEMSANFNLQLNKLGQDIRQRTLDDPDSAVELYAESAKNLRDEYLKGIDPNNKQKQFYFREAAIGLTTRGVGSIVNWSVDRKNSLRLDQLNSIVGKESEVLRENVRNGMGAESLFDMLEGFNGTLEGDTEGGEELNELDFLMESIRANDPSMDKKAVTKGIEATLVDSYVQQQMATNPLKLWTELQGGSFNNLLDQKDIESYKARALKNAKVKNSHDRISFLITAADEIGNTLEANMGLSSDALNISGPESLTRLKTAAINWKLQAEENLVAKKSIIDSFVGPVKNKKEQTGYIKSLKSTVKDMDSLLGIVDKLESSLIDANFITGQEEDPAVAANIAFSIDTLIKTIDDEGVDDKFVDNLLTVYSELTEAYSKGSIDDTMYKKYATEIMPYIMGSLQDEETFLTRDISKPMAEGLRTIEGNVKANFGEGSAKYNKVYVDASSIFWERSKKAEQVRGEKLDELESRKIAHDSFVRSMLRNVLNSNQVSVLQTRGQVVIPTAQGYQAVISKTKDGYYQMNIEYSKIKENTNQPSTISGTDIEVDNKSRPAWPTTFPGLF